MSDFKIYLSNLGAYTRGNLRGSWISLPCSPEELHKAVKRVLGKDEEFFITDYNLPFEISEYVNIKELNNTIQELKELDLDPEELVALFKTSTGDWKETAERIIQGNYSILEVTGDQFMDESDISYKLYEEQLISFLGEVPENLIDYIDWDQVWRECNISHGWVEVYFEKSSRQFAVNI